MEPCRKSKSAPISSSISEDIMPEILKRLPAKTLCRFRCVCKSWNSLIRSPFLVNLHHSERSTTPPHLKPYLQIPYFRLNSIRRYYDHYTLHSDSSFVDVHFPFEFGDVTRSNFPSHNSKLYFKFVDIVHGLVCLSATLESSFDYTLLWNPTIHKYLALSPPPPPAHLRAPTLPLTRDVRFDCRAIGFGYDTRKNDFKVVRLWIPCSDDFIDSFQPMHEIYSSKEATWTRASPIARINGLLLDGITSKTGCFVNGTIHWLVTRDGLCNVLMFECSSQEFKTMELPVKICPLHYENMNPSMNPLWLNRVELFEYAGVLCALVSPLFSSLGDDRIDMWALEESVGSWNKMFTIEPGLDIDIIVNQPLLDKRAPYGPAQWGVDFSRRPRFRFEQVLSDRVYEESLFLMDDPKALSYAEYDTVCIQLTNGARATEE